MNFFQTHKHTHEIPNDVLKRAIVLSPKGDWTDPDTEAYQYLKKWALNEDDRRDGKPVEKPVVHIFEGVEVPAEVMGHAESLGNPSDKRTKAYKYLKNWIKNNEES